MPPTRNAPIRVGQSLLRKYERELKRLRAELEERSRNLVDKRHLMYVEGERRRAEADKMAAIRALEVTPPPTHGCPRGGRPPQPGHRSTTLSISPAGDSQTRNKSCLADRATRAYMSWSVEEGGRNAIPGCHA